MKLNIMLSENSINHAVDRLMDSKSKMHRGMCDCVDILCMDGAEVANASYAGMATAFPQRDSEDEASVTGHIGVTGDNPDKVIIAEFGAGDLTMGVEFENKAAVGVPVEPGSYSNDPVKGAGQYASMGFWVFGGKPMRYVKARTGLLDAKLYVMEHAREIAGEVIKL